MISFFQSLSVRKSLYAMLLTGFCLRALLAIGLQYQLDHRLNKPFLIMGDANYYWELGENIVAGEPFAIHIPPRRVHRMPGFPALLAVAISLSKGSYLFTRLLLAGVGTFACWLVFKLGSELRDESTGLLAGWLAAISPMMTGFSVLILGETLFGAMLVVSLIAISRSVQSVNFVQSRQCYMWAGVAGAMITAACYVRPSWLLITPFFALFLVWKSNNRWRGLIATLCLLTGLFATLAPWVCRNHRVTGHWVLTTLWAGPSLYDGFNPQATGKSNMYFIDKTNVLGEMTEYEANVYFRDKAWEFIKENPVRSLELGVIKQIRFWSPYPLAAEVANWWIKLPIALFYLAMMGTAVWGGWKNRQNIILCLLTAGPLLYFAAIHTVFLGSMRYRHPAEYPLCILSAIGLQSCLAYWQKKRTISQAQPDLQN